MQMVREISADVLDIVEPHLSSGQDLMDVGSSEKWAKAPPCSWSPIPAPELRGEPFDDLNTNGGFVSFGT